MKQRIAQFALLIALGGVATSASAKAPLEGQWRNPKGSVTVRLAPCGDAWCGTVVDASVKAKASARKGGTRELIGTRILSAVRPAGSGEYKGRAFDPKRNLHAPATLRLLGSSTLVVKGCVMRGIICKEQRWTRVS